MSSHQSPGVVGRSFERLQSNPCQHEVMNHVKQGTGNLLTENDKQPPLMLYCYESVEVISHHSHAAGVFRRA